MLDLLKWGKNLEVNCTATVQFPRDFQSDCAKLFNHKQLELWWRRRESNPRPKSMTTKRDSMLSRVPKTSRYALRTDKVRATLACGSRSPYPDVAWRTSPLCDVL